MSSEDDQNFTTPDQSPRRRQNVSAFGDSTNLNGNGGTRFKYRKLVPVLERLPDTGLVFPPNPNNDTMETEDSTNDDQAEEMPTEFREMQEVEAQLMEEDEKEAAATAKVPRQPIDKRDTFKMLQVLLEKSGIYAELILKRMKEEEKKQCVMEARAARAQKKLEAAAHVAATPTVETRRRRAAQERVNPKYANFFDMDVLQAKKSRYETEAVPDLKTVTQSGPSSSTASKNSPASENSILQPKLFTGGTMRPYQLEGLRWLKAQYAFGINGILADEMGLGKTIQCIALICYLYGEGVAGPFLITAPLSTIPNWISEFERFAPDVPVVLYHGKYDHRMELRKEIKKRRIAPWNGKKVLPVVITSYELIINDFRFLTGFSWKHLIIDEAQRVKNFRCRLIRKLNLYAVESRLLLTGTPVQNNLTELWSLLNFLVPDVFAELEWFESLFGVEAVHEGILNAGAITNLAKQEEESQMLTKLHRILAPFLLRRLKSDVELELPKKKEILVYAPMTPLQMEYYKAGVEKVIMGVFRPEKVKEWKPLPDNVRMRSDKIKIPVEEKTQGPVMQNLRCIRASMVMFRKFTMHPYLLENPVVPGTVDQFLIDEDLVLKSGKMLVLDRLLVALKARGHKVLLFSTMTQMLDILMDYCQLRDFNFCRLDGSMSLEDRKIEIDRFTNDPEYFLFMISTRAGGLGLNLMAADTVVIFDSDWNPQVDLQAQDRCHRIGQTKPVVVYRLVTRGTIDERIIERATAKRRLEKMVIHSGKFKQLTEEEVNNAVKPMTSTELESLLKSTDYNECWEWTDMNKEVISDRDLERLLDRSDLLPTQAASATNGNGEGEMEKTGVFRVIAE